MQRNETTSQIRVGLFLLLGIVLVCGMVVYFGRFGDGLKNFYNLRVEYPNASGLFRGADVLLAGAKVGAVDTGPYVLETMRGVYVTLKIYEGVQIPEGSVFTIGSSGLLGDSYVDISMPPDIDLTKLTPIPPDTTVIGGRQSGIGELAGEGSAVLEDVRTAVNNINSVVLRMNEELLTKKSMESVGETLENLETTSAEFAKASAQLDAIMAEISTAATDATETIRGTGKTVKQTSITLESVEKAADEFAKTMLAVQAVIRDAEKGSGPIGALLNDRAMADNLRAFAENLRRHGILWYRDRAMRESDETSPSR